MPIPPDDLPGFRQEPGPPTDGSAPGPAVGPGDGPVADARLATAADTVRGLHRRRMAATASVHRATRWIGGLAAAASVALVVVVAREHPASTPTTSAGTSPAATSPAPGGTPPSGGPAATGTPATGTPATGTPTTGTPATGTSPVVPSPTTQRPVVVSGGSRP